MRRLVIATCGALTVAALLGQQPAPTPTPRVFDPKRPPERELETGIADGFTLAAVGDLIISRPLMQTLPNDPGFAAVVRILQGADAAFGNFETTVVDPARVVGHPYPGQGDVSLVAEPATAKDLARMGFDVVSRANNHSMDWGVEGMRETTRVLDEAGLVHAGVGENRAEARAARRPTDADLLAAWNAGSFDDPRVFETVIAVTRWQGGLVSEIRLHPIDLGYGRRLTSSGTPRPASPEMAQGILERLQRISKPYGTRIEIEEGVGIIRLR